MEEDAAYCLTVSFDVHMPLLYGEGRETKSTNLTEIEMMTCQGILLTCSSLSTTSHAF
jgi:hypothetical protein